MLQCPLNRGNFLSVSFLIASPFSFDVESLLTNVPIDAAVQAALQKLENDPGLADCTTLTPAQIADLLTFVSRSTYFQYNGSIYELSLPTST